MRRRSTLALRAWRVIFLLVVTEAVFAAHRVPERLCTSNLPEGISVTRQGVFVAERGSASVSICGSPRISGAQDSDSNRRNLDLPHVLSPVDVCWDPALFHVLDRFRRVVIEIDMSREPPQAIGEIALPGARDPEAIALMGNGALLLLDAGDNTIRVVRDGVLTSERIGSFGRGQEGMSCPHDLEVGKDGVIYVADAGNRRIQRYRLDGTCLGPWGSRGDGPDQFIDPTGVALNERGELLVADHYGHRIQVFDTTTGHEIYERRVNLPDYIRYPARIAVLPDNRCVITCPQPSEVWVLDCP